MESSDTILECEDLAFPGPGRCRVVLDFSRKSARFEHCHEPRTFLAMGPEAVREVPFDDLLAAHDFFTGERRAPLLRLLLAFGPLAHSHTRGKDMESLIISTAQGRCRVFAAWQGFAELRQALRSLCAASRGGHWSDDPRLIPLYALVIVAIVAGAIWLLL